MKKKFAQISLLIVLSPCTTLSATNSSTTKHHSIYQTVTSRNTNSPNRWLFAVGISGGALSAPFATQATYYSNFTAGSNETGLGYSIMNTTGVQQGVSFSANVALRYHLRAPYFLGLALDASTNSEKVKIVENIDDRIPPTEYGLSFQNEFRLDYSSNIGIIWGTDILSNTHAYLVLGANIGHIRQSFFSAKSNSVTISNKSNQKNNKQYIWGLLLGAGIQYDLSRWFEVFAEYDHVSYGRHNLLDTNNVDPDIKPGNATDHLSQNVEVNSNIVRLGLNFKILDYNKETTRCWNSYPANSWVFYLGGLLGTYTAGYNIYSSYSSNYEGGTNQQLASSIFQESNAFGGQIGLDYTHYAPYVFGFVLAGKAYPGKAYFSQSIDDTIAANTHYIPFNINNYFRIRHEYELSFKIGRRLMHRSEIYARIGTAYTNFVNEYYSIANSENNTLPYKYSNQTLHLWGWLVGLGFSYDVNKWINLFTEYDHYGYKRQNLTTINDIDPSITSSSQNDTLSQNTSLAANSVVIGLNFKLFDQLLLPSQPQLFIPNKRFLFFLGLFSGYSNVLYRMQGVYSGVNTHNETIFTPFMSYDFQSGSYAGFQMGFKIHLKQNPIFLGAAIDSAIFTNKALNTTNFGDVSTKKNDTNTVSRDSFDFSETFKMNYNLNLTFMAGANLAKSVGTYFKLGGSLVGLVYKYKTFMSSAFTPSRTYDPYSSAENKYLLLGITFGVGIDIQLTHSISTFIEYNYYNYPSKTLDPITNLDPSIPSTGGTDALTHKVNLSASIFKVGINFNT